MCRDASEHPVILGICVYYFSSLIAVLGIAFGHSCLTPASGFAERREFLDGFVRGDGKNYATIAAQGYDAGRRMAAYFPLYPLSAKCVAAATGLSTETSLLFVSHLSLAITCIIMAAYWRERLSEHSVAVRTYSLLALCVVPTTFFFRVAYSEALFVMLTACLVWGMFKQWPLVILALLVGVATAARPVGVALLAPFALYVWERLHSYDSSSLANRLARMTSYMRVTTCLTANSVESVRPRVLSGWSRCLCAGLIICISCWGLLAFMGYQWVEFGDPIAFAKSQYYWGMRHGGHASEVRKLVSVISLEPIWAKYLPSKPEYWLRYSQQTNPVFSLQFADPIYFLGTGVLVAIGWRKRWLNRYEVVLSTALLLMPYFTKSYDNAMASFGRFSAVVLPTYIVLGHLLDRLGPTLASLFLAMSACLMGAYAAMFATGN
jgi:hypothetical protein